MLRKIHSLLIILFTAIAANAQLAIMQNTDHDDDALLLLQDQNTGDVKLRYYILENPAVKKAEFIGYMPEHNGVLIRVRYLDQVATIGDVRKLADDYFKPYLEAAGLRSNDHKLLFDAAERGNTAAKRELDNAAKNSAKKVKKALPKVTCKKYVLATGFAEFTVKGDATPLKFQGDEAIQQFIDKAAKRYGYDRSTDPESLRTRVRQGDTETKQFVSTKLTGK